MRPNTQKLLKGCASQSTQKKNIRLAAPVCMWKPAEETKVPPFLAEREKCLFIEMKRYKWNHYARWLHTSSVKSKCDALMKKTTNRSIGQGVPHCAKSKRHCGNEKMDYNTDIFHCPRCELLRERHINEDK